MCNSLPHEIRNIMKTDNNVLQLLTHEQSLTLSSVVYCLKIQCMVMLAQLLSTGKGIICGIMVLTAVVNGAGAGWAWSVTTWFSSLPKRLSMSSIMLKLTSSCCSYVGVASAFTGRRARGWRVGTGREPYSRAKFEGWSLRASELLLSVWDMRFFVLSSVCPE